MASDNRPLSPHLQIYRWQITMALSIVHRMTGVALTLGTIVLVWWLLAAAAGPGPYATVQAVIGSWLGRLLLFGWSFALFYHLCNGIRHLAWDAGLGFEIKMMTATGWIVVVTSLGLTLLSWGLGYAAMGG
jgi:succinate dehydrogenase / fumarate reductase cytochrome b subunit